MSFEKPFENIVGSAPEASKEELNRKLKEELITQKEWEVFRENEREKTPEEKEILEFVDKESSSITESWGGNELNLPEKAVHFLNKETWEKFVKIEGQKVHVISKETFIAVGDYDCSRIVLLEHLFHDYLHFKSYLKLQVLEHTDEKKYGKDYFTRRAGLYFPKNPEKEKSGKYFAWLNEAVTQELSMRFIEKVIESPPPIEIIQLEAAFLKKEREKIILSPGIKKEEVFLKFEKTDSKLSLSLAGPHAYYEERKKLWGVVDEIYNKNPEKFEGKDEKTSKEEIFSLFARGMFTGEILEPTRLIEKTFGEGSFKKLGEWKNNNDN